MIFIKKISILVCMIFLLTTSSVLADSTSDAELIFDAVEEQFPQFFPNPQSSLTSNPYIYRYYSATGIYVGVNLQDSNVYLLGGAFGDAVYLVGSIDETKTLLGLSSAEMTSLEKTLQMAGSWSFYSSDGQQFLTSYYFSSSSPIEGTNGWFIKGENNDPYPGFPLWLSGTAVQAGYNTSTGQYYIVDMTAEENFVWEFILDSVGGSEFTGCRYRYPLGFSDKGECISFWGN